MSSPVFAAEGLSVGFRTPHGDRDVLHDVSFALEPGEVLGVVGTAGAGKSVLVRAILRLLPENGVVHGGTVTFRGRDLLAMSEKELGELRGAQISQVLPDAKLRLNPLVRVGDFMAAVLTPANGSARRRPVRRWSTRSPRSASRTRNDACAPTPTSSAAGWPSGSASRWRSCTGLR